MQLNVLRKVIAGVSEYFRRRGQSSGHYARDVPPVDHSVADLSGGDNDTNVAALSALHLYVRLLVPSVATQVVSYLLRFNRTDGPAILFVAARDKFDGNRFHSTVGFDGPEPTSTVLGDGSLTSQGGSHNG